MKDKSKNLSVNSAMKPIAWCVNTTKEPDKMKRSKVSKSKKRREKIPKIPAILRILLLNPLRIKLQMNSKYRKKKS